jgi:succinate-semialdehyde dehydrogenase / glutarate-semialdehyde dehydrogenase
MTAVENRPSTDTFDSLDPATGAVVATFPIHDQAAVDAAVAGAQEAARWWAAQGVDGRRRRLMSWKHLITERIEELADLLRTENGKVRTDALVEVGLTIDHLDWAARHAGRILKGKRVPAGLIMINQAARIEYEPFGVIGVIGPWNYPVFTPMGSILYALAAGNAVVFKPSEYTPAIGRWLVETFAEVVPEQPVLQLVTGYGPTGAALCRAGVDKLAFTGSAATGRKVMAACAERLTPVLMECGGKDAAIVDADADVAAAADALLWGSCTNAGQTCAGVERVYVVDAVYDRFVAALTERARELSAPGSYGPITMPSQLEVIRRHIDDALARGGTALVGGPESVQAPFVGPVVLADVPEDAAAVQEETFGPVTIVNRVPDADEAVRRANGTAYGLGAAVFGKARGMELAHRLRAGMVAVNGVLSFAGVPSLPFGGSGESGFGRIHGPEGLREFVRPKAIARTRFPSMVNLTTYRQKASAVPMLLRTVRFIGKR